MSLQSIKVPGIGYWRGQIKCQAACPVRTDARGYARAIAEGDDEQAYLIARGPNPLASICGRVCGAPCETDCRRGDLDKPISIRALKRFVCDQFGPEADGVSESDLIEFLKQAAARHPDRVCDAGEELLPFLQSTLNGDIPLADGQSVGVIGAGPAGLAAAHDLALLGFKVAIYEIEPVLGGMLALGVPEYRLPRNVIRAEAAVIEALGVEPVTNCEVGVDVTLPELRERHDALVIAVGAKRSRPLTVPWGRRGGRRGGRRVPPRCGSWQSTRPGQESRRHRRRQRGLRRGSQRPPADLDRRGAPGATRARRGGCPPLLARELCGYAR